MSLIETTISVLLVGILFAVALNTLGASSMARSSHARQEMALLLAQDLMSEILQHPYEDPDQTPNPGGVETGEGTANRMDFDDVDDYRGWSASPPESRNGIAIPWATGYTRTVNGQWRDRADLAQASAVETGVKAITVEVLYNGKKLVTLSAVRSAAWHDPAGQ
jgi:type II secretory pathway pseudopilin PulG